MLILSRVSVTSSSFSELPNAIFVPASDKGHIGDRLHFNAAAQRENRANQAKATLQL